eukprot:3863937-Amphidinium_carterae.1
MMPLTGFNKFTIGATHFESTWAMYQEDPNGETVPVGGMCEACYHCYKGLGPLGKGLTWKE